MEKSVQIFNYEGATVRTVQMSNEPWWVLKDVCDVLELSDTNKVAERLDADELTRIKLVSGGQSREMYVINESGLYNVIIRSDKPDAKKFRKWVTSEVLPTIRKHGAYMTPATIEATLTNPDFIIQLATTLKEEQQKRLALQAENESMKPKVEFAEKMFDSDQKIDIGQAAKILRLPFGRNTLFVKLREKGIFFSNRNEPKQEYVNRGYFELKEKWIDRTNHDGFIVIKVLVTQKGLDYLAKIFEVIKTPQKLAKLC